MDESSPPSVLLADHTMPEEEAASPRLGRARTGRGLLLAWTVLLLAAAATGSPLGPSHPSLVPGNFARNIRNLECVSRKTQEKGTCMFALSCIKMNGTHLGVCVDRFYYGSCCKLPELQHEVDLGGGDTNDLTQVGVKKPVTAANVAETSTTTAAPVTTTKAPASTAKPTTKPPKPASTTTTRKPTAKPTSATKPTTKPTSAATKPTAKPTAKPTTASPPRKPVNATVPTKPSNTTKPAKPVTIPPPTYSTTAKPASTATKPSTAKPVATKPTTAKPTTSSKPSTTASKPSTTVAKPVPTKPTTAATKPPAQPASTAATQKPTTAKPTPKPTTVTSKPITTSTTVSNEVSTAASVSSKPSVEAVEEETNAVSGTQKPAATTGKPTPPTFPTSTAKPIPSAKPTPPTFPKPVSTQKPTAPTAAVTKPVVTSTVKPVVTSAKPANVTDENWVQVPLSTTSPASVATKPTQTYPDGSLFTEEIPPSVSRPTPPTFPPKPSTMAPTTYAPEVTDAPLNMSDYKQVCGRRLYPDARIVGGTRSTFAKWPWQISLRQWRTSTYLHKCGAALLNENWAITAAHCVENVPPSDLLLRLGEHDLSTEKEPHPHLDRRVQIVASHPQFDSRTFEYDLALLRFYEPVTFQPNVIPICIPSDDKTYIGETAFVTGWGRLYEDGPLPSVMQEVSVPVLENAVCETMYRSAGYIEHIPNIFICAGWKKGGFDSCEGDSGGPMVIQRDDKRWTLAGVISWGIGCAEPNQPGVYTRISHFRDWISQILQF